MMKLRLLPLVAACAAAGLAHAGPSQEDLARVRLYGNVTIAQDSVNSWGVWEQFEPPAAGPGTPTVALPSAAEFYRPLATVEVPTGQLCASGALCAFGVVREMMKLVAYPVGEMAVPGALSEGYERAGPRMDVFVARPEVLAAGGGAGLEQGDWRPAGMVFRPLDLNGASQALLPPSSELTVQSNMFNGVSYAYGNGRLNVYSGYFGDSAPPVGPMEGYVSGGGVADASIIGVIGVTSTVDAMSALQRGNVVVNYVGNTLGSGSPVALTVDFGQGRVVSGSFNEGRDSPWISSYTAGNGQRYVGGGVGIDVQGGTVQGSNFVITQMSAKDGTVSGRIQGAFFGGQADVAAGAVDVVKSRTDGAYTNAAYKDVFFTVDQSKMSFEQEASRRAR